MTLEELLYKLDEFKNQILYSLQQLVKPLQDSIYKDEKIVVIEDFRRSLGKEKGTIIENPKNPKEVLRKHKNKKLLIISRKKLNIKADYQKEFSLGSGYAYAFNTKLKGDFILENKYTLSIIFFVIIGIINYNQTQLIMYDDLLRHLKAWKYDYDYRKMFSYSWNFSFNPYPLFDYYIYSSLDKFLGRFAPTFASILSFLCFSLTFWWVTRHWNDKARAFLMLIFIHLLNLRIFIARPATFIGFLFPLYSQFNGLLALLSGIFLVSSYYFFFLYIIPLLHKKEYLAVFILGLIVWHIYTGGAFFSEILKFAELGTKNRLLLIAENLPISLFLSNPLFIILLIIMSNSFVYPKNKEIIFYTLYFLALMQIRFVDTLILLLPYYINPNFLDNLLNNRLAKIVLFIGILHLPHLISTLSEGKDAEFRLQNANVLTVDLLLSFRAIYYGDNVTAAPSMELGFTDKNVQQIIKSIHYNHSLDCNELLKYNFTHLIEKDLYEQPECLELYQRRGIYTIWKIKRQS